MSFSTADLYDANEGKVHVAMSIFQNYGLKKQFHGQIYTIKCFEDNTPVGETLRNENGKGKVLVIDGGASLRCALVGDLIAAAAIKNEWEGIIVNGCIRDSAVINTMQIGIKALNTNPTKSVKKYPGLKNIIVDFAHVIFHPNQFIYCDEDGILISKNALL
ncbi:MAG: ribonuclease E activity regulator RraA [Chitinophagales bacterium]|nr:ribonuclease E activity regulator RraA [Chitinophagales bacterium]TXH54973.1 MAG: RraA family protein [Bacteroidia bacterium]HMV14831.1 ribonuclease E activity regulator RraA [Chitinophagales bacterium]HMW12757.1 ribonuclease E activity regulator RraA [Chitinophagales bacterium]HMX60708.1 ribonuclease E activity regulator RraA [Chitinophagales bacterium]